MRARKILIGIGLAVAGLLVGVLGFVGVSVVVFNAERGADYAGQRTRMAVLPGLPSDSGAAALRADLALSDATPWNRVRLVATHNSYRKRGGALRLFFIDLFKKGEAAKLDYGHPYLWEQLEAGIRSFELDVRYGKDGFQCAHVPLVDNRSVAPDFGLALAEIALWSERRPGHVPIVLLLELKNDYLFLDPNLAPIGATELDKLDELLRARLGSALLTPDEFRGVSATPRRAVADRAWPSLGGLRGRILIILHANETYRSLYLAGHQDLASRAMFTSLDDHELAKAAAGGDGSGDGGSGDGGYGDALFVIANEALELDAAISRAVGDGYIVRTRADADGTRDPANAQSALTGRAQIVSTDFPPAYPAPDGYSAAFAGGSMLSLED